MPQAIIGAIVQQIVQQLVQMLMEKIKEMMNNNTSQQQAQSDLQDTMSQHGVNDPGQQADQLNQVADIFQNLGQHDAAEFTRNIAGSVASQGLTTA